MDERNCDGCGKPQQKRGKKRPISERRTRLQRQGMAVLCHARQKDRVEGTSRYRGVAADAVTGL